MLQLNYLNFLFKDSEFIVIKHINNAQNTQKHVHFKNNQIVRLFKYLKFSIFFGNMHLKDIIALDLNLNFKKLSALLY